MFIELIYQWNPFNIYGSKVGLEELLTDPLLPNETLMEDNKGQFRRIKVPHNQSSLKDKFVFWLQTHLNQKGHLEAIDKIISIFYQNIFQYPPIETKKLQEIHSQINRLRSLKNDYNFIHLKQGNSAFIDSRLREIERHAYAIFSYHYQQLLMEQEETREQNYLLFDKQLEEKIRDLSLECALGLIKARFLIMAPPNMLYGIFKESIRNLDSRLYIIQDLLMQIDEMEKLHNQKFIIPHLLHRLNLRRAQLKGEIRKAEMELEVLLRGLIFHYSLAPFKNEVKKLLDSIKIDPEEFKTKKSSAALFEDALSFEVKRIRSLLV